MRDITRDTALYLLLIVIFGVSQYAVVSSVSEAGKNIERLTESTDRLTEATDRWTDSNNATRKVLEGILAVQAGSRLGDAWPTDEVGARRQVETPLGQDVESGILEHQHVVEKVREPR